jgi:orotate phosphoribosyltransferase
MREIVTPEKLIHALLDAKGCIILGKEEKTFASGIKSHLYFNVGDNVPAYPAVKRMVVDALELVYVKLGIKPDRLIGVPEGANIITSSLSDRLGIGQLRIREDKKDHGEQRTIECAYQSNMTFATVEDVTSTGGSTVRRVIIPTEGLLKPIAAITLIDREYGGLSLLKELTGRSGAFINTTQIIEVMIKRGNLTDEELDYLDQELRQIRIYRESIGLD